MGVFETWRRRAAGRARADLLETHGVGVLARTDQGWFVVDPRDGSIGLRLLRQGAYGGADLALLKRVLPEGGRLAVIGAHIGTYLIPLAQQAGAVTAYEPDPTNHALLRLNCKLNDVDASGVHALAVGDRGTAVRYRRSVPNTGHGRIDPASLGMRSAAASGGAEVEMVRFDDHEEHARQRFDLILVDVEGAEWQVLQGMPRTLETCGALFIEFGAHHAARYGWGVDDLIASLAPHFQWMAFAAAGPGGWAAHDARAWPDRLRDLASQPKRLVNLLFTRQAPPVA